jgi:hypothetical protein
VHPISRQGVRSAHARGAARGGLRGAAVAHMRDLAGRPSRPARPASCSRCSRLCGGSQCTTHRTSVLSIPMPKATCREGGCCSRGVRPCTAPCGAVHRMSHAALHRARHRAWHRRDHDARVAATEAALQARARRRVLACVVGHGVHACLGKRTSELVAGLAAPAVHEPGALVLTQPLV